MDSDESLLEDSVFSGGESSEYEAPKVKFTLRLLRFPHSDNKAFYISCHLPQAIV